MAATFAAMMLLYALFAKFVPIISIWELKAGRVAGRLTHAARDADRIRRPRLPPEAGA